MAKKILGFLSKEPLIWLHYALLLLVLWFGVLINNAYLSQSHIVWTFLFLYIVISLGDQAIHKILGVD